MLCDSHIHFGQYYNYYVSARDIVDFMQFIGVNKFAVSSTTICEGDYAKVLDEMREVVEYGENRVIPTLWISPKMLSTRCIEDYLNSGIHWGCIKTHGFFHDWHSDKTLMSFVINLARTMCVPLLLHTGGSIYSEAQYYLPLIKENPDIQFILAHARSIEQTISILSKYPNAYTDTAFVPTAQIRQLVDSNLENQVLFGTDYIIPRIYKHDVSDMQIYYQSLVSSLQQSIEKSAWYKISHQNFETLFLK